MLFNHDFYKSPTTTTYFAKCVSYDLREDDPLVFQQAEDGESFVLITNTNDVDSSMSASA